MYHQFEFLRQGATLAVNSTYRLDLPETGYLSALLLHVYGGGVTDSMNATEKWRIPDYLSKIEVIANGSTILKSYTGQLARYLTWRAGGISSPDKFFNYGSSTQRFHFMIPFGRTLFDPTMGLDLSRYNSVELQITNDATASYYASGFSADVACVYQRDTAGNPYSGFLRTEEWRKWTTVAAEWKYLDLPTELPIRNIIIQTLPDVDANNVAETTPYNVAYSIKCNLQTGLLKVFDGSLRDLWYLNAFRHGRDLVVPLEPYTSDAKGIHTGLGQTLGMGGVALSHDGSQSTYPPDMVPGEDSSTQERQCDADSDQTSLLLYGLSLENCAELAFDQPDEAAGYLDPERQKVVQLNIQTRDSASAADGTIRVILDRLVRY